MRAKNRESDVVKSCLQFLQMHGIFAWRQNTTAIPNGRGGFRRFAGMRGCSDILGCLTQTVDEGGVVMPMGLLLAVECKKVGGRLTEDQEHFLATVNRLGGIGICVRDTRELEEKLRPYLG